MPTSKITACRRLVRCPIRGLAVAWLMIMCLAACQQNGGTQNEPDQIPKSQSGSATPDARKAYFHQNFPLLAELCTNQPDLERLLTWYAYAVKHPETELKKKQDYGLLFDMRHNRAVPDVEAALTERVENKDYDFLKTSINDFERELNSIGLQTLRTPTKIGIGAYPVLDDLLQSEAGEMVRLYARFQNAAATARKGEHPYIDLSGEIDVVGLGEEIYTKFPSHKYTESIKPAFESALSALTDVHKVVYDKVPTYVVGSLEPKPFPYATDPNGLEAFLEKYPVSRYAPVVRSILQSTSEIAVENGTVQPIYLVVAEWAGKMDFSGTEHPCQEMVRIIRQNLEKGLDIAHPSVLTRKGEEQCAVVYRFFPDRERAEKALAGLKAKGGGAAGIFKAAYNPETFGWEVAE